MTLELSLENIAKIAKEKEQENQAFAKFIKVQDSDKLDKIMLRLGAEFTDKIDCAVCGSCCNNLRPIATEEAMRDFVEPENIQDFKYLKCFSCKNLDGTMCKIYLDRPLECREFPYMHRDKFVTRTNELFQTYEICPIVYNAIESLKTELSWVNK